MKERSLDILALLVEIAKRKKIIIWCTGVMSVVAVAYSLLVTQYWRSTALVYPSSQTGNELSIAASMLGTLGSSLLSSGTEGTHQLVILQSRSFSEDVIKRFKLDDYMELTEPDSLKRLDEAIKQYRSEIVGFSLDETSQVITINATTSDKQLSADIANYCVSKLLEYNSKDRKTKSSLQREFLEKRVRELNAQKDSLLTQMKQFAENNKTIEIEQQSKGTLDLYTNIIAQKKAAQIELEYARKFYGDKSPNTMLTEQKFNMLNQQQTNLEKGLDTAQYLLKMSSLPELSRQYASMQLDYQVFTQVYQFIYPQYEAAKLAELHDAPALDVIDYARPAGLRQSPKRALICIFTFIGAFLFSTLGVAGWVLLTAEQRANLIQLKKELMFKKQGRASID